MKIARAKYPKFAHDEHWCWNVFISRVLRVKLDRSDSSWEELVEKRIKSIALKCDRREDKFWAYIRQMIRNALTDELRSRSQKEECKKVSYDEYQETISNHFSEEHPESVAIAEKIFPNLREKLKTISLLFIEDMTLVKCAEILGTSKSTIERLRKKELELIKAEIEIHAGSLKEERMKNVLKYLCVLLSKEDV